MVKSPKSLGLPYVDWRTNQADALKRLDEHETGLLCLQAPTGSGKTGIALAWGISGGESGKRTLILTQRNTELTQYENVAGFDHQHVAFIRGQRHYHCLLRGDKDHQAGDSDLPDEPCKSEKPYCDLPECQWPRFDDNAPCQSMKKPHQECQFYKECPYILAREKAREASVVVTNYGYGVVALRIDKVIGEFDQLVADEAHDLLSILTEICSLRLNLRRLNDALTELLQPQANGNLDVLHLMAESRALRSGSLTDSYTLSRTELGQEIGNFRNATGSLLQRLRLAKETNKSAGTLIHSVEFARRHRSLAREILLAFDRGDDDSDFDDSEKRLKGNASARFSELDTMAQLGDEIFDNFVPTSEFDPELPVYAPIDLRRGSEARKRFWDGVECSIAMSGTLPQARALEYSLGLEDKPELLRLPQEFPPERRPVFVWNKSLDLRYNTDYRDRPVVFSMVDNLLNSPRLSASKGIVLWPSYRWMNEFLDTCTVAEGKLVYHSSSQDANDALETFKEAAAPSVFMSPTAYQGIDLPGKECRFVIIVRPFWPVVSPGTLDWFRSRKLPGFMFHSAGLKMVQAAGRGFRTEDDWCEVYIVDKGTGNEIIREISNPDYELNVKLVPTLLAPANSQFSH